MIPLRDLIKNYEASLAMTKKMMTTLPRGAHRDYIANAVKAHQKQIDIEEATIHFLKAYFEYFYSENFR